MLMLDNSPLTGLPSGLRRTTRFVGEPLEVVSQQQESAQADWGKLRTEGLIASHRRTIHCPGDEHVAYVGSYRALPGTQYPGVAENKIINFVCLQ